MSAARHARAADAHAATAEQHEKQYDPTADRERERCQFSSAAARTSGDVNYVCWTSVTNPTAEHLHETEEHRLHAADHRAASASLRDAEARACAGLEPDDRDMSPFVHTDDITSVAPLIIPEADARTLLPNERAVGAVVAFRAVPGMTAEWLQRIVDCHLARNASLGHVVPEMPDCPLVPNGAQARVTPTRNGFAVAIRADEPAAAREILARAERLRARKTK